MRRAALMLLLIASAPIAALEPLVPVQAIDLIIGFEVGSPAVYTAKYRRAIWPGGASGATIGIGYDLGHRAPRVIVTDWEREPERARLASAAGITGPLARDMVQKIADIAIEYGYAREVFDQTMIVEHYRLARRAFGKPFDAAPGTVRGALVSVVFNRGSGMAGRTRAEMRTIRDECLPDSNWQCVADNIRAMARINAGTPIARGIARRRNAEAAMIDNNKGA